MGKAKRERKEELNDLRKWFEEFSLVCPWRALVKNKQGQSAIVCVTTKIDEMAMICQHTNCAPLFIANRLIQMTFGNRIYDAVLQDKSGSEAKDDATG